MDTAMAPFEQQRRSRHNVDQRQHDSTDEVMMREGPDDPVLKRDTSDYNNRARDSGNRGNGKNVEYYGGFSLMSPAAASPTPVPGTSTQANAGADVMSMSRVNPPSSSAFSWSTPALTTISIISPRSTPSQGRKEVNPGWDDNQTPTPTPSWISSAGTTPSRTKLSPGTALGDAAGVSPTAPLTIAQDVNSLSPSAQYVLISGSAIGAVILIAAVIYFVMRFDVVGRLRRYTRRGRGPWRSESHGGNNNDPPPYATLSGEKSIPPQRKLFIPIVIPSMPMVTPQLAEALSRADSERQALVRAALLSSSASYGAGPSPPQMQTFDIPQAPQPTCRPSDTSRQNQRVSDLSSLSSGFGDAKIDVPESGPTRVNIQRKSIEDPASQNNAPLGSLHASWTSAPQTPRQSKDNRDTLYTTTSEESAPRFRTVNSWVSQQTRRIQRQQESDREVDNMPEMPETATAKAEHQRSPTEVTDPAFRYHPGDEVQIKRGTRVPSAILDKII